ncbi:hypothetical protein ARMSODRAFT_1068397 [Armillaria solidipes]|uniref:Uncharacterized protein n=1 Tax=Armillaria solidipes TaxID=1076256 RepID=A0A2H3ASJ5_9AGAR|nr:hypothetical protein ARMSODRAFT_1068397 [Armillaria solidipes]
MPAAGSEPDPCKGKETDGERCWSEDATPFCFPTITLSWHRDVNDSSQIQFGLTIGTKGSGHSSDDLDLSSTTDITQPDGTLTVTFPGPGIYVVYATNQTSIVATTRRFQIDSSTLSPSPLHSASVNPSVPLVAESEVSRSIFAHPVPPRNQCKSLQLPHRMVPPRNQYKAPGPYSHIVGLGEAAKYSYSSSSSMKSVQITATTLPNGSSSESVQSTSSSSTKSVKRTATAPPNSNSVPRTHKNHKRSIIIAAVIGSLVSLLLLFGGGTFFFIRKRRHRNLKHRLSPNSKVIPELNSHSPPVGNKNGETISHTLAGEMTPNRGDGSLEPVEQNPEGDPVEDEGERRNSIGTPVHVDTSESQSPHAPLDDVGAEVLRLRDHVHRLVERVQGNVFDPPPAYA